VKLDPYFASAFTCLGHYYREIKRDNNRAKKCYQKAYLLNPLDAEAAHCLSDYLIVENKLEEAENIFRQVTESCPKVGWAWRRMGYVNMKSHTFNEAIICFQKALRTDTSDVRCWEGLAESYSRAGRFVAALKAFDRATQLDPHSIHANHEKAYVQKKVGLLDDAIATFKHTLALATEQGKTDYVPALAGLAETYLDHAKEDFQAGFFGRASNGCNLVFQTVFLGLQQDSTITVFWKLVGDACAFYRHIPSYLNNCAYKSLQDVIQLASKAHDQLKLEADVTSHWVSEFLALQDMNGFSLPQQTALDVVLSCASYAYKQVIVLSKNHKAVAPDFWHDLAVIYYHISWNNNKKQEEAMMAIKCAKIALKLEPTQYMYWNTLGVIAMAVGDLHKISQYGFIKAIEFNNRSAIPWTNYGFLCLTMKDYELANQAFEMAHSLDPEWISAWVGQAHVASLWGDDAAVIFEHAFESSNGSALEASYGYAQSIYQGLVSGQIKNETAAIMPVFALEKLTEKKLNDALSLNLMGLLSERLGQYGRAAESFASAILAVEAQMETSKIGQEEGVARLAKIRANLGRTLCASGDFEGAIASIHDASGVYAQLNAGIAYYFLDRLPESLGMFESALNATQDDISLRQDVVVLLGKVLWALGGEEQRAVAKDQLFSSITDNPNYLPAIFSLCVMGMLENDDTLTAAALQELAKISVHIAYESDKEQLISWLFAKFYQLGEDQAGSIRALVKSVHQTPWLSLVWNRLCTHLVQIGHGEKMIASSALIMSTKSHTANAKSEAYECAALTESQPKVSRKYAQRAVILAPWRLSAWKAL
ncbi:Superkiller protein 3, partial [Rhizopus stolonifer]